MTEPSPNIYQRVNAVRKAVSYVQKDKEVGYGSNKYRAVTHDQVTAHVRAELIKQGIIIVPSLVPGSGRSIDVGQTQKGATIIRYEADFMVSFVSTDDPASRIDIRIPAHANDSGDKAPGKAISYAVKLAILKLFSLETGVDDEGRLDSQSHDGMVKHLVEEVTGYVDANDALAINLLQRSLGQETWTEIYNAAPAGKKQQWKKTLASMESMGLDVLQAINVALQTEDAGKAAENMEDLTEGGKRLLFKYLGTERGNALGALIHTLKGDKNV